MQWHKPAAAQRQSKVNSVTGDGLMNASRLCTQYHGWLNDEIRTGPFIALHIRSWLSESLKVPAAVKDFFSRSRNILSYLMLGRDQSLVQFMT